MYMEPASTIPDSRCSGLTADLLKKLVTGDHDAFGILVRSYSGYAYNLAMRFVWDTQEAEDIVQEAFIKVWDNIGSYEPERKFTTWLYAIVTRESIDRVRRRNRWSRIVMREPEISERESPALSCSPEEMIDAEDAMERIRVLVERLPRAQRLVFTLRDMQDLPVDEVVEITAMSSTTVKANLWHARRRLREMMERSHGMSGS
jgi:RNA polymerase sigma-70 factor, ECF subfamily